jgi:hypothetical protein
MSIRRTDTSHHLVEGKKINLLRDIKENTNSLHLNTDTLEALITDTNAKLQEDIDFSGTPADIADTVDMKQTMLYGYDVSANLQRPVKVDSIGKISVDSPAGSDINTRLDTVGVNTNGLNNCVSGNELQVDIVSGTFDGVVTGSVAVSNPYDGVVTNAGTFAVQSTVSNPFDGVVSGTIGVSNPYDGVVTNAGTFAVQSTIQNASLPVTDNGGSLTIDNAVLTNIDACISSNKLRVDIVGGGSAFDGVVTNAGTFAVQSTIQNASLPVTDNGGSLTIDNTVLTNLDACISGSELQVDIVSSGNLNVVEDYKTFGSTVALLASTSVTMSTSNTSSSVNSKYNQPYTIMVKAATNSDWDYEIQISLDDVTYVTPYNLELLNSGPSAGQNAVYQLDSKNKYWRVKITNGSTTQNFTIDYVTV